MDIRSVRYIRQQLALFLVTRPVTLNLVNSIKCMGDSRSYLSYTRSLLCTPGKVTNTFVSLPSPQVYSVPHEESRKIANTHDILSNHRNTLDHAKWLLITSSLAWRNYACRDKARKYER